jgi:hypothetical protein
MRKPILVVLAFSALAILPLNAQEKPAIVVQPFKTAAGISWPYDMKQLVVQTVAEVQHKNRTKYDVSAEVPAGRTQVYKLDAEVLEWNPGNRAMRVLVRFGTGRETAKIHYWLSDDTGKRVFEHEDVIRQKYIGSADASSVGQLSHPFADKIAKQLSAAIL